ncbi:PaaI family thioesterase [Arthrobacter sp. zg-Y820]|uniref:PaaI family thioesterase n=1 Tax=unclassified Arthrobacter TaxID=235627 RepID=UPI001E41881C|nr:MULTISPECIES: PaaI family thioesterase [unclassified Arthrobacter]MCC9196833.1 PaaI family thioesterase [Arthrobacter sp. zg-Y820]MDK1279696.1 PaaI family thioesterase [Arthrobacter sp. zg.Y820]WIB07935.1 PaaI family thioesterase [Arthrobacter sp. zg-Y820]
MENDREYGPSNTADTLMAATRRLMLAATTTTVSEQQMLKAAERLDGISSRLEASRAPRMRRIPFTPDRQSEVRSGAGWRMFPYNALGIPQLIEISNGEARSRLRLSAVHEGPPDMLHGGFGAALLDAVLGVLVMAEVTPAFTAELTLTFHHPTPIGEVVEVSGKIVELKARTVVAEGAISHNGRATLSARGIFVPASRP